MSKAYVGNLDYEVTEKNLIDLFSKFGSVQSAKIILDPSNRNSKGFGFVEMASQESMLIAIGQLDGTEFFGRPLKINEARPISVSGNRRGNNFERPQEQGRKNRPSYRTHLVSDESRPPHKGHP
jgi:RNA recognition motif-containing protein